MKDSEKLNRRALPREWIDIAIDIAIHVLNIIRKRRK